MVAAASAQTCGTFGVGGGSAVGGSRAAAAERIEDAKDHIAHVTRGGQVSSGRNTDAEEARFPVQQTCEEPEMPAHGLASLQRCVKQFHSAPITELASVPEFGLHSLIRSHSGSIRRFGAHVFRIVAPEERPVSSRMPKRLSWDKIRMRVQTFP